MVNVDTVLLSGATICIRPRDGEFERSTLYELINNETSEINSIMNTGFATPLVDYRHDFKKFNEIKNIRNVHKRILTYASTILEFIEQFIAKQKRGLFFFLLIIS